MRGPHLDTTYGVQGQAQLEPVHDNCHCLPCPIILIFIWFATVSLSSLIHYQVLVPSCLCPSSVFSNSYVKKSCCSYIVRQETTNLKKIFQIELVGCFLPVSQGTFMVYAHSFSIINIYKRHMLCLYLFPCLKEMGGCNS
jgi:hypothetical protein